MAEVLYESDACECCVLLIANDDESGCRDYCGHEHRSASVPERVIRQLSEQYGAERVARASLVVTTPEDEDHDVRPDDIIMGCEFCGRFDGYMHGWPVAIIG